MEHCKSPVNSRPNPKWVFFRELRGVNVTFFCFLTPKAHIPAWNRVVWRITRENRFRGVGCRPLEEPGKKRSRVIIFDAQFRTYEEKKPIERS